MLDLGHRRNIEALSPVGAFFLRQPPRISLHLDSLERSRRLSGKLALHQGQMAPHVDDSLYMLDRYRASLFAPSAGRASPYRRFGGDLGNHVGTGPFRRGILSGGAGGSRRRDQHGRLVEQMLALTDHEKLRVQRLTGLHRRAIERAAAAFEARRHVEKLLPAILLDLRDAKGLGVFKIDDRPQAPARTEVAEEKIHRRDEDMAQLGKGKTEEQRVNQKHVNQPEIAMERDAGTHRALDAADDAA